MRNTNISISLSYEEKKEIKETAKKFDMAVSAFIRKAVKQKINSADVRGFNNEKVG